MNPEQLIMSLEKRKNTHATINANFSQQMSCRKEDGVLSVLLNISCSLEAERGPLNSVIPAGILLQRLVYRIITTNID